MATTSSGGLDKQRIVDKLQDKLQVLSRELADHHQRIRDDFHKLQDDLLESQPASLVDNVRQAVTNLIPDRFPDLAPFLLPVDSRTDSGSIQSSQWSHRRHRGSPPPPLILSPPRLDDPELGSEAGGASQASERRPSSPRSREKEFQGIFTPGFLPLLDSSHQAAGMAEAKSSTAPPPDPAAAPVRAPPPSSTAPHHADDAGNKPQALSQQDGSQSSPDKSNSPISPGQMSLRPGHMRRATDDTTSSIASDHSDSHSRRRSALRRSSSASNKPKSPHRVRFEMDGDEVLPSTSPPTQGLGQAAQATAHSLPAPTSLHSHDSSIAESILDVDPDEPPPKRVSSTQRLRELSKIPLKDTEWTEVTQPEPNPVTLPPESGSFSPLLTTSDSSATITQPAQSRVKGKQEPSGDAEQVDSSQFTLTGSFRTETVLGRPLEERFPPPSDKAAESSEEDDYLSIGRAKQLSSKKAMHPSATRQATSASLPSTTLDSDTPITPSKQTATGKAAMLLGNEGAEDNEGDDFFDFEMPSAGPKQPRPPQPAEEEAEEEEDSPTAEPAKLSAYSASPAIGFSRQTASTSAASATSKFQPGSLGSYRGRPVIMPVITNPELQAQLESMDNVPTFVGGLDGRSGVDAGDLSSFRASLAPVGSHLGEPKSLSERLLKEEAEEAEEQQEEQ